MPYETSQIADLRVLIVDNHEDSLELATIALECFHANVLAVRSAKQAMQALHSFQPAILISELHLPEEDGYSLMRKARAYLNGQRRQVFGIALTTQVSEEAKVKAFAVGFCQHIAKPYSIETLIESVAQLSESGNCRFGNYQCCI